MNKYRLELKIEEYDNLIEILENCCGLLTDYVKISELVHLIENLEKEKICLTDKRIKKEKKMEEIYERYVKNEIMRPYEGKNKRKVML